MIPFGYGCAGESSGTKIAESSVPKYVPLGLNRVSTAWSVLSWLAAALGVLKVDCLCLGMLTAIRKCFALVEQHYGRPLTLATVPADDSAVYDMLCKADTVGVFQVESRAQMATF